MKFNLATLLTSPQDIIDLAHYLPDFTMSDDNIIIKDVLEKLKKVDSPTLLSALFDNAQQFARMCLEIASFFNEENILSNAKVQLPSSFELLSFGGFTAPWAIKPNKVILQNAPHRVASLAASVAALSERINFSELIFLDRVAIERRLQLSPKWKIKIEEGELEKITKSGLGEFVVDGDYNAIKRAHIATEEALNDLSKLHLHSSIRSSFEEIESVCRSCLDRMENSKILNGVDANPVIATLNDEVAIYSSMAKKLMSDLIEAEQVANGFGDFLKSSLWIHRWRVFEIWILVKTIETLRQCGGNIEILCLENNIWKLPYASAKNPVGKATFESGYVNVFYQPKITDNENTDMPDILLKTSNDIILAVIDPKHGMSYSYSRIRSTGVRYFTRLGAIYTAIVNYLPVKSYDFESVSSPPRSLLFASNIRPGSITTSRFFTELKNIILTHGFFGDLQALSKSSKKHRLAHGARLLFWVANKREIDEDEGAWIFTREVGAYSASELSEFKQVKISAIYNSGVNSVTVLYGERQVLFITSETLKLVTSLNFSELIDCACWNHDGSILAMKIGDEIVFFNSKGKVIWKITAPTQHWGVSIKWIGKENVLIYSHSIGLSKIIAYTIILNGNWKKILDHKTAYLQNLDCKIFMMQNGLDYAILKASAREIFKVTENSAIPIEFKIDNLLGFSPSGRWIVKIGPISIRAVDGVALIEILDNTKKEEVPLVRYFGEIHGEIQWTPDERHIAFFVKRRFRSGLDELRLVAATVGEKDAVTISLPGQNPKAFSWIPY